MRELLFLDSVRLNRYCAQVVPSMSTMEHIPEHSGEISLAGPKLSLGEKGLLRPLTEFEKLSVVLADLTEKKKIRNKRPETEYDHECFVHEECSAVKVVVPRAAVGDLGQAEFTLWLAAAPKNGRAGMLCLLEDFRGEDIAPVSFRNASTYTLLQSLIHYSRSLHLRTVLDRHVPGGLGPPPERFAGKPDSLMEYANVKDFCYDFATDPVSLLGGWGCVASAARSIEVVYRIREFGKDAAHSWQLVTVFGYPIWIIAR